MIEIVMHYEKTNTNRGGTATSGYVGQANSNLFEPRSGKKNFLGPPRGSGGMLPQKILKISFSDWLKIHFLEYFFYSNNYEKEKNFFYELQ